MDKREKIAILLDENALIIESINDITSILKELQFFLFCPFLHLNQ
jgi:hypothetical protein